jgi:hypothetical protein
VRRFPLVCFSAAKSHPHNQQNKVILSTYKMNTCQPNLLNNPFSNTIAHAGFELTTTQEQGLGHRRHLQTASPRRSLHHPRTRHSSPFGPSVLQNSPVAPSSTRASVASPDSPAPGMDTSKSFYRQAFADVGVFVTEGFLEYHPKLHGDVAKLLTLRPCIPFEVKDLVYSISFSFLCRFMECCQMTFSTPSDQMISTSIKKLQSNTC